MPPKANPDAVNQLGLEDLADEQKRQEVTDFFKARADLLAEITSEKQQPKTVLREKMQEYNRTQSQTQQIIDGIIQELQKDSLERDMNEGFTDADGHARDSYTEQFHKEVERVGVDFEGDDKDRNNPVRLACLAEVIKMIRAVPANMKRSHRHEYVKDLIADYVKKMDDAAETWKVGTLKVDDLKKIKPKSGQEWAKEPGRPPESELMQKYDPGQAKEFIQGAAKTKENISKIAQLSASYTPELKGYFEKGSKEIEGFMVDNPSGAAAAAQRLVEEATAVTGIIALQGEIKTKHSEVTDEPVKKRYTELLAKIDTNLKAMPAERDPAKRKALIDLAILQGEKSGIDASVPPPTPTDEKTPTPDEPVEPDMMKDPKGWLTFQVNHFKKYLDEIIGFVTGIAGLFGVKSVVGKVGASAAKSAAEKIDPAKLEIASKFLKEKFKITTDEFKKLAEIQLGDFLKLDTKPDWMDAGRFAAMKTALAANKSPSDSDDTLLTAFVLAKKDNWKEPAQPFAAKAPAADPNSVRPSAPTAPPSKPVPGAPGPVPQAMPTVPLKTPVPTPKPGTKM